MRYKTGSLFIAGIALLLSGFVGVVRADAGQAAEVRQSVDRASREPAFASQSTTVIIESDQGAAAVKEHVSAAGGKLRYSVGKRHEVDIPNGSFRSS